MYARSPTHLCVVLFHFVALRRMTRIRILGAKYMPPKPNISISSSHDCAYVSVYWIYLQACLDPSSCLFWWSLFERRGFFLNGLVKLKLRSSGFELCDAGFDGSCVHAG